jgi:hypothetical protein
MPRSRAPRALQTRRERDAALARCAPRPDPAAWLSLICERCEQPFKFRGIARHCVICISQAAACGVVGSEWIGEASGA